MTRRRIEGEEPATAAPLMEAAKIRDSRNIDNDWDDDGFWDYGYHNDPKRRRRIRRAEKNEFRQQVRRMLADGDFSDA